MTTLKYPGLQKYDEKIKEWVANVTSPMAHTSGNENISGIKNFSESPLVPTPAATDDSKKSVNSEWVRAIFSSVGGFSFGDDGKVYVDFSQMDPAVMRAVVTAMVLPGGGLASDAETGNLYVDFDEMDPEIMEQVVLSMVQPGSGLAVDDTTGQLYVDFSLMPMDKFEKLMQSIHVPVWIGENGVGTEFYVDGVNGQDNEDSVVVGDITYQRGRSTTYPWRTIGYATNTVCKNYNINTREVHINVAGGTYSYTSVINLPLQQRTTGSIVIRPYTGETVYVERTATSGGEVFAHTGGKWFLYNLNIKIIAGVQSHKTGGATTHLISSTDDTGSLTLTHCNLSFEDNTQPETSGTYGFVNVRLIYCDGGNIILRNVVRNNEGVPDDTWYESSWSGTKGNARSVAWIYAENGGIISLQKSGSTAPRNFSFNISGSYSVFCHLGYKALLRQTNAGDATTFTACNSPTGKRYEINGGSPASTGVSLADVKTFFPGDVDGTIEKATYALITPTYSGDFSPTPVYSVTLAEDVPIASGAPYTIELDSEFTELCLFGIAPTGTSALSLTARAKNADGTISVRGDFMARGDTNQRWTYVRFANQNGHLYSERANASGSASSANLVAFPNVSAHTFEAGAKFTNIELSTSSSGENLPAGLQIIIYGSKEAQ